MLFEQLLNTPFCIYGAGIVATSIYTAIKTLYHQIPLFFLVSDTKEISGRMDEPPIEIDGIVVKRLSKWQKELQQLQNQQLLQNTKRSMAIPKYYLIAVPEAHHQSIVKNLHSLELFDLSIEDSQIILFTNELENELMEAYYSSLVNCTTVLDLISDGPRQKDEQGPKAGKRENSHQTNSAETAEKLSKIQIFQAKSHMDKPLQQRVDISAYITPLQAGASLTKLSVADLKDNTGDNISEKNRNYCELTATYHAWKNSRATYKGICHYRRIFDIDEKQMQTLLAMEHKWDVILPYPSVYYPNISKEHTRYVNESDWNAMLQALRETAPEYLAAYEKAITDGEQFFSNFNMLIAKAEIFDDYCNFLFTVLERTEKLTTSKGWERADRFAGYLGENLTTIYFLKNREKIKVVYAGKMWLT